MTAYTNILFPAFQLASGRWVKVDMSTQSVAGGVIGQPYTDAQVTMDWNPWALGGLPEITDEANADTGMLNLDSLEFVFHNVAIKESVDSTTLYDLLSSVDPQSVVWNIRYWISPAYTNAFNTAPDFWGIVEASEIEGDLHLADATWNTYRMTARNLIALAERVSVDTWLNSHLTHAAYDQTVNEISIDGVDLEELYISNADGSNTTRFLLPLVVSTDPAPAVTPKMFKLIDVLYSFSTALGITQPVNVISTGSGSVPMTWEFIWIDSPNPSPGEYSVDYDDLYMMASLYHTNGSMDVHDQKWTFFDHEKLNAASVIELASMIEAIKYWTVPFGLTARVAVNSSGQRYLEVRELELTDTTVAADADLLEGLKIDAGEKAAFGFRVVTSQNNTLVEGDEGDRSIDQPWIGASRIRLSARWDTNYGGTPGVTDDTTCLNMALYCIVSAKARNIFKVKPKRDGTERTTASTSMPYPPAVYGNPASVEGIEAQRAEFGSVFARAAMSYYWNGGADPDTDAVGIHRRYTKRLTWRETGIVRNVSIGSIRTVAGVNYVVRRRTVNASEDWTEFEGERGTYHASP